MKNKIVIILGAGASKEFGLPVGEELKGKLSQLLDIKFDNFTQRQISGDPKIADTYRNLYNKGYKNLRSAGLKIANTMTLAPSIDNYLHTHSKNKDIVLVGKMAICNAITRSEQESYLRNIKDDTGEVTVNLEGCKDTWIAKLFKVLVSGKNFDDFLNALSNLEFLCFNYDRCVQQYFYFASKVYFDLGYSDSLSVLEALNLKYVYGSIGAFEPYHPVGSSYGYLGGVNELYEVSSNIKIFTEGVEDGLREKISETLVDSKLVMFLGFGFLPLNMDLLLDNQDYFTSTVIGTALGVSKNSTQLIEHKLKQHFYAHKTFGETYRRDSKVELLNVTCSELIFEHNTLITQIIEGS